MIRPLLGAVLTSSVLAFAFLGCNSILDNNPGTLLVGDEAGTIPDPGTTSPPGEQPNVEDPDASAPTGDSGGMPSTCPAGQQMCFGACVSMTDPLYGCGDPSCKPCPSGHSTMSCQGRKCVVSACDKGYSDCNANAGDGCETDFSKATSCGACNAKCGAAAPLCAPSGPTFQCTNGCTPGAPLNCGAECVDPLSSTNHCGGCNIKCPEDANGTAACATGVCNLTCKPQFHACTGKCVAKTDPATCGAACAPCPVPAGGVATCVDDVCGIACTAPNHACGGKCVTNNDPTACGAACTVCPVPMGGTATCTNGACGATCPAGTHACADKCVADNDATACGAACTVCAVPANATAACAAGACGLGACAAGFGNCDMMPANGCETNLTNDPANCGACGTVCAAPMTCVNSVCQ